ncbi:unnamed protein product [Trichobilharzia szidati]|nr:unnamed protein product [Trichobilharzia szidati]
MHVENRSMNEKLSKTRRNSSQSINTQPVKYDKAKIDGIIERLANLDKNKYPVECTSARIMLGFNRYDFGCSPESIAKPVMKKMTQEEILAVIDRLTQYDITKCPPGSRGHEKKQ